MDKNGQKWTKMDKNGQKWTIIIICAIFVCHVHRDNHNSDFIILTLGETRASYRSLF
jgi:hypothetical protein